MREMRVEVARTVAQQLGIATHAKRLIVYETAAMDYK